MNLNPSQLQAVNSDARKICVIAGPGSGKTRVLTERIKRLIEQGERPSSIVAITYTNKAADEILIRLEGQAIGYCGTLHGFMLPLLQQCGECLGYENTNFGIINQEQADEILEQCCKDLNYRGSKKEIAMDATGLPGSVARRYRNTLVKNSLLSFDLILSEGFKLLKAMRPASSAQAFKHLLVDECQDCADIDFEIYHALRIKNKMWVGDADQSIFAFRGGNISGILALCNDPEVDVIRLEANYRSDILICEAAQNLIEHNTSRIAKETFPISTKLGAVEVREFDKCNRERIEIGCEIADLLECPNPVSIAVLFRYNHHVNLWVECLENIGIPVQRKKFQSHPNDWNFAKLALVFLSDPESDWMAYQVLKHQRGETKANSEKARGIVAGCSINSLTLMVPENLGIKNYPKWLTNLGVSRESMNEIQEVATKLDLDATGADILLALNEAENIPEMQGSGIHVGTIHGAKGKEWDYVFLPATEQEIMPGVGKNVDEEELRRLFFVGITRAQHRVIISHAKERAKQFGGGTMMATPSQFISELGLKELL